MSYRKTGRHLSMPCSARGPNQSEGIVPLRLSNLQVILLLLLAGTVLIAAVLKYTSVAGRIPVAMWDICTTVMAPANTAAAGRDTPARAVAAPVIPAAR